MTFEERSWVETHAPASFHAPPRGSVEAAPPNGRTPKGVESALPTGRRTLLIADDSPTIQKVVSLTFGDEGFHVIAVGTGAQALAELEREAPDILLADVHMPAPGGYELCARAKRDERTRHIPVILLVGAFEPFDEAEARESGADDFLTKPFQSIRDLVNKVGGLLGGQTEAEKADARRGAAPIAGARRADANEAGADYTPTDPFTATAPTDAPYTVASSSEAAYTAGENAPLVANAYSNPDLDDADIESVPAEEFTARRSMADAETVADEAVEAHAARDASVDEFAFTDAATESSSHVASESVMNVSDEFSTSAPQSVDASSTADNASAHGFEARATAAAAADDTLLELGDIDAHAARFDAPDDFVLDFDDEAVSDDAARSNATADENWAAREESSLDASIFGDASRVESAHVESGYAEPSQGAPTYQESSYVEPSYVESAFAEDAPSAVEMQSAGSVSMAEPSALWDATEDFAISPDAITERVKSPAWEEPEVRAMTFDNAGSTQVAHDEDAHAAEASAPAASVVATETNTAHASDSQRALQGEAQLSPETVDAIARRVVELISDGVVREIAWEVVPDLAERLIRQRLEEERPRQ